MDARRTPRQGTDWRGWYRYEGDDEDEWRRCRILDVSTSGAALELFDARLEPERELAAGRLILVSADLRGEVRYAIRGRSGGMRVGIELVEAKVGMEFDDLTSGGIGASFPSITASGR